MVYVVNGGNVEADVCDKKPCVWKGVLLSFLASLPFFTHGLETIELSASVHSGHFVYSNEDVPWNATALITAAIITAPIYCYAIDRYGRKVGLFIVSLVQGASCIPLFLPRNLMNIISFHVVAGISTGGLFTVLPTYIVETNSLKTQGFSLCLTMVMTTAGYLMKLAMDLEYMMYLLAAMVMVQLLSILMLVESPAYFVKVGKLQEAMGSISTLKSLEANNQNLANELSSLTEESRRAKSKGKLNLIGILKNEIYRDGTKIGIIMFTTMVLCGSIVFLDQDKTLKQLKMASDPDRTLVLVCLCAGSFLSLLFIWFLERRYLITLGYTIMVLSMGLLAVYTQMDLTVTSLRWLPVAALGALVFGYGIAWGLPYVIMVETYNFEIRAKMISFLFIYAQILRLIHIHTFKYIEDYVGIYTIFYIFTFINLYGCVYCLFAIPDLRGKTNRQIERQLKRIPLLKFNTRTLVDNK